MSTAAGDTRRRSGIAALALGIAAGGLVLDLYVLPLEMTSGLPYIALVMLSLYTSRRWVTHFMGALAIALVVAPVLVRQVPLTSALLIDRTVAFIGIGAATVLTLRWKDTQSLSRQAQRFSQSIIDALGSQIAVLDPTGRIAAVNEAWTRLAQDPDGPIANWGVGTSFLDVCRAGAEEGDEETLNLAEGTRSVLAGERSLFSLEYPWGEGKDRRWFAVHITGFQHDGVAWGVIDHHEITVRKRAELEVQESRATYRELATRDELTGVYNRRAMDRMLAEEVERYHRYGNAVALILIDIDHFKAVNDTYGHPVGDAALRWLADLIARNVRSVDRVARYGGEEFVVIAPEQSGEQAYYLAERLRRLIVEKPFVYNGADGEIELPITVSMGAAAVPADVEDAPSLLDAADKALYAAKRSGRNCTVRFAEIAEQSAY